MQRIILNTEADSLIPQFSAEVIEHVKKGQLNRFEVLDGTDIIYFKWYNIKKLSDKTVKYVILQDKEDLVIICPTKAAADFMSSLLNKDAEKNDRQLYNIFSKMLESDADNLEKIEEKITVLEDSLMGGKKLDYQREIISIRKDLMLLKKYYFQLSRVFEGIEENENGFYGQNGSNFLKIMTKRIERLHANTVSLRDYAAQVHDSYCSQMDLEQNGLMKVFTVVSTIFLPLGLITGWYGMNLKMPETQWEMGYPFAIVLSVFIVTGCLFYFKKRKWF